MARRHPILRAMFLLALSAAGLLGVIAVIAFVTGDRPPFGNSVAVLEVRGVIQDASDTIETLERFRQHDGTVAVVLRIDSPGGAVAPSQELYDEVWRVRGQKPVVASL